MVKPLVRITWDDAEDPEDGKTWLDAEDVETFAERTTLVVSVGFLLKDTAKYYTLASDYIERLGHFGRVTKIPKSAVQSVETLEKDA